MVIRRSAALNTNKLAKLNAQSHQNKKAIKGNFYTEKQKSNPRKNNLYALKKTNLPKKRSESHIKELEHPQKELEHPQKNKRMYMAEKL